MPKPKNVKAYIAAAPLPARSMLKQLRAAVKSAAPKATEGMSYGMPYYSYRGRLIYFAAFKHHIGLYVMGRSQRMYLREAKKYKKTKATLQFPLGTKIPVALVKKLVKARAAENDKMARAKKLY